MSDYWREILDLPGGWVRDAACREHEHERHIFFPEPGENELAERAKAICAECLVKGECLDWALGEPATLQGIWGGTSRNERRAILRERKHAAKRAAVARGGVGDPAPYRSRNRKNPATDADTSDAA